MRALLTSSKILRQRIIERRDALLPSFRFPLITESFRF